MPNPTSPTGRDDFRRELATIWADPRIRRLALSRAGNPEIADDALQQTYCVLLNHKNPEKIEDLRKYFAKTLIREVYRLLRPGKATPVDNIEDAADACQGGACCQRAPEPFDRTVVTHLLIRTWIRRLATHRGYFTLKAPGRSPNPRRYRGLIVIVAERILVASLTGDISDADFNPTLRAEYPEWFAAGSCETANGHQRLKRARDDVRELLQLIASRDDLYY